MTDYTTSEPSELAKRIAEAALRHLFEDYTGAPPTETFLRVISTSGLAKLEAENTELNQLFDLGHTRTREADKLWQDAHNKPHVYPDLGELIGWLLRRLAVAERESKTYFDDYQKLTENFNGMVSERDEARRIATERNDAYELAVNSLADLEARLAAAEREHQKDYDDLSELFLDLQRENERLRKAAHAVVRKTDRSLFGMVGTVVISNLRTALAAQPTSNTDNKQ
jgi:hypothetical protein